MKKFSFLIVSMILASANMCAQKVADKELIGVWLMESMQWKGENKMMLGKEYTQIKYYGPDGEYACAELAHTTDGQYVVLPHEYGTYSFANGKYTEMGRNGELILDDPNTFHGHWKDRLDVWKKTTTMPRELLDYIISKCKANQQPTPKMQQLIKKHCFK